MQLALLSAFDNEVVYQVVETLVLTVGVVLGWLVWPAIRQKLAQRASQRKEAALLQEAFVYDADMAEDVENDDVEDEDPDLFRDEHLKVAALFDHYGLFGAPLGAWNSVGPFDMDLEEGCSDESAEELAISGQVEVESMVSKVAQHQLFEHYGLFGAPVGAWSS